eukprot:scaffold95596_cov47-Cyclotella_meneghiniana.AAC.3
MLHNIKVPPPFIVTASFESATKLEPSCLQRKNNSLFDSKSDSDDDCSDYDNEYEWKYHDGDFAWRRMVRQRIPWHRYLQSDIDVDGVREFHFPPHALVLKLAYVVAYGSQCRNNT